MKIYKVFVLFSVLLTISCVKTNTNTSLKDRVNTFWKIRLTGNYSFKIDKTYTNIYFEFLSEKSKKSMNEKIFFAKLNNRILEYEIDHVDFNNSNAAIVTMRYTLAFQGYTLKDVKTKDKWVLENGKWMIYLNPNSNPFWR